MNNKYQSLVKRLATMPVFIIVFALLGLLASAAISIEKTHLLQDPEAQLTCSLNPVYSCQSVVTSDQASVFGFSNELIGIAFFGGVLALGIGMLAGAVYKKWLHVLVWLGLLGSMGMVIWFFYQSVYNINALCIYCTTVWFATWTLFVGYTKWLIDRKLITLNKSQQLYARVISNNALFIWLSLIVVLTGLILNHFWYYYGDKLGF